MVMRPSPTFLLPDQVKMAPVPDEDPSKEFFAVGSSFAQGDHASQLWKLFTCANTDGGGAEIAVDRWTRKVDGCRATITRNTTTRTAAMIIMFMSIGILS